MTRFLVRNVSPLFLCALGAAAVWLVPNSIHWRDAAEFQLTAHYLDIAHPAGFPAYAQISNLFSLLPFGPLVWRVNFFSLFIISLWLATLSLITEIISKKIFRISSSLVAWIAVPLFACLCPPTLKSAFTAEVYGLHALLLALVLAALFYYKQSDDVRSLGCAAILAGLALSNHVAALFFLVPLALLWVSCNFKRIPAIPLASITVFVAASIYAFILIRAHGSLALNTGSPTTFERFLKHVTDARDSALRPLQTDLESHPDISSFIIAEGYQFYQDLLRLLKECGLLAASCAVLGFFVAILKTPLFATSFAFVVATDLLFFSGWDSDPWLPSVGVVSMCATLGMTALAQQIRMPSALTPFFILMTVFGATITRKTFKSALEYQSDRTAADVAQSLLQSVAPHSALIVEPSWFITRAESLLEGVRDDVTIINAPSLLFPDYFSGVQIRPLVGSPFDSLQIRSEGDFDNKGPAFKNVGRLLNTVCKKDSECSVEPTLHLSNMLKTILISDSGGTLKIKPGYDGSVGVDYARSINEFYAHLLTNGCHDCGSLTTDLWNYIEVKANNEATLFLALERPEAAFAVLNSLCSHPDRMTCSGKTLTNIELLSKNF